MLPIADAVRLLVSARDLAGLQPFAPLLGCAAEIFPISAENRRSLGVPPYTRLALGTSSDGRRTLLAEFPPAVDLRAVLSALAARLTSTAPQLHWAVAACVRGTQALVLATWVPDRARPRLVALSVERDRVVDSDAETVRLLADASTHSAPLAHARWMEILGREALGGRFFRALATQVEQLADAVRVRSARQATAEERRTLALLCVSRLLFLGFVEAKGWLDGDRDFLQRRFADTDRAGTGLDCTLLRPLFFGTLNTPVRRRAAAARAFGRVPFLNGGLFSPTSLERRAQPHFPDAQLGGVVGDLLARWRFTAREDRATWSDAAVDPEMLGRAFESLMAEGDRRRSGAFFTPQPIVRHVTHAALASALATRGLPADELEALLRAPSGTPLCHDADTLRDLRRRVSSLRVLDPACGSGAFLVYALELLAELQGRVGDPAPVSVRRRRVLTRQIHGVDANPTAVWLCELRLWLSTIVEDDADDPMRVPALPNLDRQIRVGDALDSDAGAGVVLGTATDDVRLLARVRDRYVRASGPRKRTLGLRLDQLERARARTALDDALAGLAARRRELLTAVRSPDLFGARRSLAADAAAELVRLRLLVRQLRSRRRKLAAGGALPFAFATHCAEAHHAGGFDLILGNPPWVRAREITAEARARLTARYEVLRRAAWSAGARGAGAGAAFGAQPELAAAFVERACELLAPGGTVALLVPAKLWRTLAGGGVRRYLLEHVQLRTLEDWSEAPALFDAVTYPSLVVAERPHGRALPGPDTSVVRHASDSADALPCGSRWSVAPAGLSLDRHDPASPWLLLPPAVRTAFERVRAAGMPLAECGRFGRPLLGVKTGCNAAFVVRREATAPAGEMFAGIDATRLVPVSAGGRSGAVESGLLRPAARGEDIAPWAVRGDAASLLWTHGVDLKPLQLLPPGAAAWLRPLRATLSARSDSRGAGRWWSIFRLDAADPRQPRLVWADIGRRPACAVLAAGNPVVPLNSCYVLRCPDLQDALALATLLNGPLAAAWLAAIAEPARGGYHRYLGWTMALLPLPVHWMRVRAPLAAIGRAALAGSVPDDDQLLGAALTAFGLAPQDVEPLLHWWRSPHG